MRKTTIANIYRGLIIIALILLCTISTVILYIQIDFYNGDFEERKIVDDEIIRRIDLLGKEGCVLCLFEVTPFIWDNNYSYFGYYSQLEFDELVGELEKEIIFHETSDYAQRKIFTYNHKLIHDCYGSASTEWYILGDDLIWGEGIN